MLPVRYEELTVNPALHLRRICSFLDVPWEEALLHHPRIKHTEIFENGLTVGETDPNRSIDGASVGQWRHFFDEEQLAVVESILDGFSLQLETALNQEAGITLPKTTHRPCKSPYKNT